MQLHNVKSTIVRKHKKRVGRGGKRGTYSGRGIKGQKSRAGRRIRPALRDVIKKLPKKRGYRMRRYHKKPAIVNVGILEKHFEVGEKVTPNSLHEKGIVKKNDGKIPQVKLLSSGKLTKQLLVESCQISSKAKEKIIKAGGSIH